MNPEILMPDLTAANPVKDLAEPPPGLFATIVSQDQQTGDPVPARPQRKLRRRLGQGLMATIAVLVIGVGASWAATGEIPIKGLFADDLAVEPSSFGLDSISTLQPATAEAVNALPRDVKMMAALSVEGHALAERVEKGGQPGAEVNRPGAEVGVFSGIGFGETSNGTSVTLYALNDQICVDWEFGAGVCSSLDDVQNGVVGGSMDGPGSELWRLSGLVPDDVVSVEIVGSQAAETVVNDNVFEFRGIEPENLRLVGLDADGDELLTMSAPIAGWANAGR